MPRSSRHKSLKQSKYSSKDYSESEEDVVKIKEKSRKDDNSIFGHRESASGEKRKVSSQSREGKDGKNLTGSGNGDAVDDYFSAKRRKEKTDAIASCDRWNGGGDERRDDGKRMMKKEIRDRESFKHANEIHKLNENSSKGESLRTESKSKSKKLEGESGSVGERQDDVISSVVMEKEESKSKSESKRKSEREYLLRKEGKELKNKDHKSEKENRRHKSKSADAEIKLVDSDVEKKQRTQSVDVVGERQSKRSRENNADRTSLDELRNLNLDNNADKNLPKKREGSSEREKYYEEPKKSEVRRSSFITERSRDLKYRDDEHRDGSHAEKYQEDGHRDVRRRDKTYREESDRNNKYHGEKYRDDDKGDSRLKDDRHHEDVDRDSKHRDEKHRDNGARDVRRKDEKYREDMEREIRIDDKYYEDRDHEDVDKDGRRMGERYYEDGDKDDRHRDGSYRDKGDRDYRHKDEKHKDEKYRDNTEKDLRYKDSKQRDVYDRYREKRPGDFKYGNEHTLKDRSGDKFYPKRHRDDGYATDHHVNKSSAYDESPTRDDRAGRSRDDQDGRRTSEKEDCGDVKSRSSKDQRSDAEKRSASGGRMDSGTDRMRYSSRSVDIELASDNIIKQGSPAPGSHAPRDKYRAGKQDEPKSRDYSYEERSRHNMNLSLDLAGPVNTPSQSIDKFFLKDDKSANLGNLSTERRLQSDIRSSPLPVGNKSPSSSVDRRQFNSRRIVDGDTSTQRSGGSKDWKDYPAREGKTRREFGTNVHPCEDLMQANADTQSVSSPFARNSHFSSSYKSMAPRPPSLLGPAEGDGQRKPHMRHRRMSEDNSGRMQGNSVSNAWRGTPPWPSPVANGFLPFPHAPPPVSFPQPFHAPQMFGIRPSLELSNHPSPYHVPDADQFAGPGWQSQLDNHCPPSLHGWDTSSALFGDQPHMFLGWPEWDLSRNISGGRGWEMSGDLWKEANRTQSVDLSSYEKESNSIQSGDGPLGSESIPPPRNELSRAQLGDGAVADDVVPLAKMVEKNDDFGDAVFCSGASGVDGVSGKDDGVPLCSAYLSKLDLSTELTEPGLFDKCASLIGADKTMVLDADDSKILYMEGVEAKIGSLGLSNATLFASSDDSVFEKSMSLYKRQREHVWAEYREKPRLCGDENANQYRTEKLYPPDDLRRMQDETVTLQLDIIDQSAGNVITENPEEGVVSDMGEKPLPGEMVEKSVDVNSGMLSEASEAVMPESVDLSRIHHSPESTH